VKDNAGKPIETTCVIVWRWLPRLASPSIEIEQGFGLIPWDERLAIVLDDVFFKIPEVFVGLEFFDAGFQSLHGAGEIGCCVEFRRTYKTLFPRDTSAERGPYQRIL
jgi:hypothetical protein